MGLRVTHFVLVALTVLCLVPGAPRATAVYSIPGDDASESAMGLGQTSGDFLWMTGYTAVPGGQYINTISLVWGTQEACGTEVILCGVTPGHETTLVLYDDPTDDGNPSDAIVLAQTVVSATVEHINTDVYLDVPIVPTAVAGDFYVAAFMRDLVGGGPYDYRNYPGSLNRIGGDEPQRSWYATRIGGGLNPGDFSTFDNGRLEPVTTFDKTAFMLRAVGVAFPEPTSLVLLASGVAAVAGAHRRCCAGPHETK